MAISLDAEIERGAPLDARRIPAGWPRAAAALGALLVLYGGWQLLDWPPGNRPLVGNLWFAAFALAQTVAAALAARRCAGSARLRNAWRLLALGAGSYLLGQIGWTVYELMGRLPYPSVADGFSLAMYPLTLAGLLTFPTPPRDLGQRVRIGIDLATVAIGGSAVVVYVVLGPTILAGGSGALQTAFSIAYPVGDMVLLVGLASVLLRGTVPSSARALQFMAAGLGVFIAADMLYGWITLNSTYTGGDPADTVYVVAMALMALAAVAQTRPAPDETPRGLDGHRRASWAPFAAVLTGVTLLLVDLRGLPLLPDLALLLAAVALMVLVSLRQVLAQRDLVMTQGRLSYQSLHDALTGLPNRVLVIDRAEQMLARARRRRTLLAALYVDVDGFKQVNDSYGHAAGDEVLRTVASRLTQAVREADTVGRLGGDEFVVLIDGYTLAAEPELIAERIIEVISQPMEIAGAEARALSLTVSVGIATGDRRASDELLRDADLALYAAKGAGKNRWLKFESQMQVAVQDRLELEMDLREALSHEELFLLYQPTFDLEHERMTGVEALLRWRHPRRGVIAPGQFVPLAEETGLIVPIGRWVLRAACEQAARWRRGGLPLSVAVNVSGRQLEDAGLAEDVAGALRRSGLEPASLTLEITETALMRDSDTAAGLLRDLKEIGVRIAIDDFGTGYSSLAYLRQFPVDALKIDRSFISGLAASSNSKALIHTLVQLGKTLGLDTLGEGIEQDAQLRQLQREQCDEGQGFLFARPMAAEAVAALAHGGERASSAPSPLGSHR